jgi:ribose transport system permease protein
MDDGEPTVTTTEHAESVSAILAGDEASTGKGAGVEDAASPGDARSRPGIHTVFGRFLAASVRNWSGVYVAIGLVILFGAVEPKTFLTVATFRNTAAAGAITAITSLGLLFPVMAGEFDLSIGYLIGSSGVLAAWLMGIEHAGLPVVFLLALLFGLAIGVVNAVLVILLKINSFIATLAMGSLLTAFTLAVSHDTEITGVTTLFTRITDGTFLSVPVDVVYTLVIAIIAWYVTEHTPVGRRLYALGGGRSAARLAGVRVNGLLVGAFAVSALLAAVGGLMATGQVAVGSPTIGPSYLLAVFAAVFLGATQVRPGRPNVWGTLIAVYVLGLGVTGLQLAGQSAWVTNLFNGCALIIAVGLANVKRRARPKTVGAEGGKQR